MEVLTVLRMWRVIMDRVVQAIFLIQIFKQHTHAVRHDQQNKEKATRQVNTTSQSSTSDKKDKINQ
jgi:hypothetical protein